MRTAMKVGGCVIIPVAIVAVALIGGGAYWWFGRGGGDLIGIGLTSSNFFNSVHERNWNQAHAQLSASAQQSVTAAEVGKVWQQYQATHGAMQSPTDASGVQVSGFMNVNANAITYGEAHGTRTASFTGRMNFATSGPQDVTIRMVKENGAWKIVELPVVQPPA